MWQSSFDLPDKSSNQLRALIAEIDAELAKLEKLPPVEGLGPRLRQAWTELTTLLAIDDEPATRACPACGRLSRAAATRCAYCWGALHPGTP